MASSDIPNDGDWNHMDTQDGEKEKELLTQRLQQRVGSLCKQRLQWLFRDISPHTEGWDHTAALLQPSSAARTQAVDFCTFLGKERRLVGKQCPGVPWKGAWAGALSRKKGS